MYINNTGYAKKYVTDIIISRDILTNHPTFDNLYYASGNMNINDKHDYSLSLIYYWYHCYNYYYNPYTYTMITTPIITSISK